MSIRPVFVSKINLTGEYIADFVESKDIEFNWFPGFAVSQKQKSIKSLHENAKQQCNLNNILEISTKSENPLGSSLSAFNLMYYKDNRFLYSVECLFQSCKVFEKGGPFIDIRQKTSREAKKDIRLKESGKLVAFRYKEKDWDIEFGTAFYDWLYINALYQQPYKDEILEYEAFTDIEFNPQKSLNCQARSVALYVALVKSNLIQDFIFSEKDFLTLYNQVKRNAPKKQISMLDIK